MKSCFITNLCGGRTLSRAAVRLRSLTVRTQSGAEAGSGYGYQFWLGTLPPPETHIKVALAMGNGGQIIVVDKSNEMVTVITAGNYNKWNIKNSSEQLIFDFIYPALN